MSVALRQLGASGPEVFPDFAWVHGHVRYLRSDG